MTNGFRYPPLEFLTFVLLYPTSVSELINGWFTDMFTWVIIIGLENNIWGVPTTLVVVASSFKFLLKFLHIEILHDP